MSQDIGVTDVVGHDTAAYGRGCTDPVIMLAGGRDHPLGAWAAAYSRGRTEPVIMLVDGRDHRLGAKAAVFGRGRAETAIKRRSAA